MANFDVQLRGFKELAEKFYQLGEQFEDQLEAAVKAGALIVVTDAKGRAPKKTRTLSRSIHMETMEKSLDVVVVAVGTNLEYAAIQEFGGVITPNEAEKLVFEVDGQTVFADAVQIPAQPYLRPAIKQNKDAIQEEVADAFREILRGATK